MMLWKQWLPSHPFPFSASFRHIIYDTFDCNPVRFLSHSSDWHWTGQILSSNLAAGHGLGSEKGHLHELILSRSIGQAIFEDGQETSVCSFTSCSYRLLSFLHGCSWACFIVNSSTVCTKIKRWFDYTSRSSSQHLTEIISQRWKDFVALLITERPNTTPSFDMRTAFIKRIIL